jgi:hypothetical protein
MSTKAPGVFGAAKTTSEVIGTPKITTAGSSSALPMSTVFIDSVMDDSGVKSMLQSRSLLKSPSEYVKIINDVRFQSPTWSDLNRNISSTWKTVNGDEGSEVFLTEVDLELKKAQDAWESVCENIEKVELNDHVMENLMTALGTKYESEHSTTLVSLSERSGESSRVLQRDSFVNWYVLWVFDADVTPTNDDCVDILS